MILSLSAIEHEPRPAVRECLTCLIPELLEHGDRSPPNTVVDQLSKLAAWLPAFSGARHCQKKLWFQIWALLLNNFLVATASRRLITSVSEAPARSRFSDQLIGLVDIGLVMLAVVEFQRLRRTCAEPARPWRKAGREVEGHGNLSPLMRECRLNELSARSAPLFIARCLRSACLGAVRVPQAGRPGTKGDATWARSSKT